MKKQESDQGAPPAQSKAHPLEEVERLRRERDGWRATVDRIRAECVRQYGPRPWRGMTYTIADDLMTIIERDTAVLAALEALEDAAEPPNE